MIYLKIEHDDIDILRALEKRFWIIAESMGCKVEHRKKNEASATNSDKEADTKVEEQS